MESRVQPARRVQLVQRVLPERLAQQVLKGNRAALV
jgi:hypothetical protein